jgi:methyl-accepting chemotaxis protein
MVNTTAEAFKSVAVNVTKVGSLVSEVAEASKEQSTGITQITKAMAEMDKVTQANAATAEEAAAEANQLSHQAGNLLQVVHDINVLTHGPDTESRGKSQQPHIDHRPHLAAPAPAAAKLPAKSPAAGNPMPMDDKFEF